VSERGINGINYKDITEIRLICIIFRVKDLQTKRYRDNFTTRIKINKTENEKKNGYL
jgi:hypothetical protein